MITIQVEIITNEKLMQRTSILRFSFQQVTSVSTYHLPPTIKSMLQLPLVAAHYKPAAAYLGLCSMGHQRAIREARHLHPETGLTCAPRPRSFLNTLSSCLSKQVT